MSLTLQSSLFFSFDAFLTGEQNESLWYSDSDVSTHMSSNEGILASKSSYSGPIHVSMLLMVIWLFVFVPTQLQLANTFTNKGLSS